MVEVDDEEVKGDESLDEYAQFFRGDKTPKICITSCLRPTKQMYDFIRNLLEVFPNAFYYARKKFTIKQIVDDAKETDFTDLIVVNEDHKEFNGLTLIHLPNGPTAFFRLSNVVLSKDIPGHGTIAPDAKPEVMLNNFNTRLGHRVGRMFGALFNQEPNFRGAPQQHETRRDGATARTALKRMGVENVVFWRACLRSFVHVPRFPTRVCACAVLCRRTAGCHLSQSARFHLLPAPPLHLRGRRRGGRQQAGGGEGGGEEAQAHREEEQVLAHQQPGRRRLGRYAAQSLPLFRSHPVAPLPMRLASVAGPRGAAPKRGLASCRSFFLVLVRACACVCVRPHLVSGDFFEDARRRGRGQGRQGQSVHPGSCGAVLCVGRVRGRRGCFAATHTRRSDHLCPAPLCLCLCRAPRARARA